MISDTLSVLGEHAMRSFIVRILSWSIAFLLLTCTLMLQTPRKSGNSYVWDFTRSIGKTTITESSNRLPGQLQGNPTWLKTPIALQFNESSRCIVQQKVNKSDIFLPRNSLSVSAWVRVDQTQQWGAIIGCFQDNGNEEFGWLLGYKEKNFAFAVASEKSTAPSMTYLEAKTPFELGKWYQVTGVYNGQQMQIYVNGKLEGTSNAQSGRIAYANSQPFVIGRYQDADEDYPFLGALQQVELDSQSWTPAEVSSRFETREALTKLPSNSNETFLVEPYLQFPTLSSISILWETYQPGISQVEYGKTPTQLKILGNANPVQMHEFQITGLEPSTSYLYRVRTKLMDGREITSALLPFRTAVTEQEWFSFGVIGDTQANPKITGKIANLIQDRRPHFVIHCGDVVDVGPDNRQWTEDLFRPCARLFSVAPVFPTIGNHERNHANYYKYFALPKPEYYYTFRYGNAEFYVLDSNKSLKPDSEQYQWLDSVLSASTAKWKIAYHHHPVWSSDKDDYGPLDQGRSTLGDMNTRSLMALYDKHRLDVAFNGHIHIYERTWPIRAGKIDREQGVHYITSGGGGGRLEDVGMIPTWFKAQVLTDFHYCFVQMKGNRFEFKAYDQNGNLFDFLDLEKK